MSGNRGREDYLYFLLGYLNSTFFRKYYLAKGGRRGGRVSFTQRLLENVEIPLFSDEIREKIIYLTKGIISKLKKGEDSSYLEKEIDDLIYSSIEEQKFNNNLSKTKREITLEQWGYYNDLRRRRALCGNLVALPQPPASIT